MENLVIPLVVLAVILGFRYLSRARAQRYLMFNRENVELESLADLETLFSESACRKQILFLHDPWCPISGAAARRVSSVEHAIHLIDVSERDNLSRMVETRTGIRHESPQLLIIEDGKAIWHASHQEIQAADITRFLKNSSVIGEPGG